MRLKDVGWILGAVTAYVFLSWVAISLFKAGHAWGLW